MSKNNYGKLIYLLEAKFPYGQDAEQSNAFRAYVRKEHPELAKKQDIDEEGLINFSGLRKAYEGVGEQYEADKEGFLSSFGKSIGDAYDYVTGNTSKDKGNLEDLNAAREKGDWSKYVGLVVKRIAQGLGSPIISNVTQLLSGAVDIPLHYQVLIAFMTLRDSNLEITDDEARKAMHNVCEYAWKDSGKPKGSFVVNYKHYHNTPQNKKRPTYAHGMSIKDANSDNLYAQLSAFFGNCTVTRNDDGTYDVQDQYDFNVYRTKSARKGNKKAMADDFAEAIPTWVNTWAAFGKFWAYLTGDTKGKNAAKYLEPLLLQMETQLNYKGVPTSMTTKPPNEKSMYDEFKSGVKSALGREDDESLIPGVNIPLLERKTIRITKRQLNSLIVEMLKK